MRTLLDGFIASLSAHAERPAVCDGGDVWRYADLGQRARRVACALPSLDGDPPLGAIYVRRGAAACAAILGVLWSGRGYVPVNPHFPLRRNARLLARARPDVLVIDAEDEAHVPELLADVDRAVSVIVLNGANGGGDAWPPHRRVACDLSAGEATRRDPEESASEIAYLLFTSGTTGEPKGIGIRHASVRDYLAAMRRRHALTPDDRVSQAFDLTFDLSVHDLFACWDAGACLYPVPDRALQAPASFIRANALTVWFCVPSLASRMSRLHLLRPDAFPSLRLSLFCGEALPVGTAAAWREAAPRSALDNLYGPTETTIAITGFRCDRDEAMGGARGGVVPIGWALPGQRTMVCDEEGRRLAAGTTGELWLGGSQVACGYWRDGDLSARRFVRRPDADNAIWFRTGDLAEEGADGCLHHRGRCDDQIKIRGFRVELPEIDGVLRDVSRAGDALAVAWPSKEAAEEVLAVVPKTTSVSADEILAGCRAVLPRFMTPRRVIVIDEIPRGANGKLDRQGLARLLREERVS